MTEKHINDLVEAAKAARPYLQDEADKYEDDGSNEPLEALRAIDNAIAALPAVPSDPFQPAWPEGLQQGETFELRCDDKGRNGGSWLRVMVANDGDVHLLMQDWEDVPEGAPSPIPSLRCRTFFGGGRNERTHQALLWLAQAIRLDSEGRVAPAQGADRASNGHTDTIVPAPRPGKFAELLAKTAEAKAQREG